MVAKPLIANHGTNQVEELGSGVSLYGGTPIGGIIIWSGAVASPPDGFILCDGTAISRTDFATLFTIIGTTFGSGNGSSTFNIPNLRDRFIVGAGSAYNLNATGGSKDAIVVEHNHSASSTSSSSVSDPGHFHTTENYVGRSNYQEPRNFGVGTDGNLNNTGNTNSKTTGITVSTSTSTSINNQGVSGTDKNLPPYIALAYMIRTI